ncbi:MAG: AraC family transcriptional regulator [Clostridia bacterium]
MKAENIYQNEAFSLIAGKDGLCKEFTGIYTGDLLSFVMSRASQGDAWITVMGSINTAAVASLTDVCCIILAENAAADKMLIEKANDEDIPLFKSKKTAVEIIFILNDILKS